MIKHYIEDKNNIPAILDHGWMVLKDTWTDCPPNIQEKIGNDLMSQFFGNDPKLVKQNQEDLNNANL